MTVPGAGDALVFYAVFGEGFAEQIELSPERYRARGVPAGIQVTGYHRGENRESDALFTDFLSGNLGALLAWDLPGDVAERVRGASACQVIVGTVVDPADVLYLLDVVGLVEALCDAGGVAILDALALRWWTPYVWRN